MTVNKIAISKNCEFEKEVGIAIGPALRIGKLGNCLGPQSLRGPRVLTAKQNCIGTSIGTELSRPSMRLNYICLYILLLILALATAAS